METENKIIFLNKKESFVSDSIKLPKQPQGIGFDNNRTPTKVEKSKIEEEITVAVLIFLFIKSIKPMMISTMLKRIVNIRPNCEFTFKIVSIKETAKFGDISLANPEIKKTMPKVILIVNITALFMRISLRTVIL